MNPIFFVGPAVAALGLVAVFFVMRHKSVEKRSMYSSRRSQIEHKVRAARQRTLAPARHGEKAAGEISSPVAPTLTYEPSAYAGPPVAPPPKKTHGAQPVWDAGPTAPAAPPSPPTFAPPAPAFEPPPPDQAPPPYEAPPAYEAQPAYETPSAAPAAEPVWTPTPPTPEPARPERVTTAPTGATSAGAGASWSVVGETKGTPEPQPAAKKKKSKDDPQAAWSLASGVVPGEEPEEGPKRSSTAIAVAQYAVLVLGLVMVLIGVIVTLANSHAP